MSKRVFGAWFLVLLPAALYVGWCMWGFLRLGQENIAKDKAVSVGDLEAQPIIDPVPNSLIYFAPLESTPWTRPTNSDCCCIDEPRR